jgi:WD40 repeat protein
MTSAWSSSICDLWSLIMPWPLSQDYNEAIQDPPSSFSDPDLQNSNPTTNALGLPTLCSGNFADVYQMRNGTRSWAVKCFTREVPHLRERYLEIGSYLQEVRVPFTVPFKYLDQGIRIGHRWFPILKMDWIEGPTLNQFIKQNLHKPNTLEKLAKLWIALARNLRSANLTHCDLQHGNVLLVPGRQPGTLAIKLVDYDGMMVPSLEGRNSGEVGHPAYQHPQRGRERTYSAEVDRFPLLVIYCAIRALVVGGQLLWDAYDNGDNLLFRQQDFESPGSSPLFSELLTFEDTTIHFMVEKLIEAVGAPLDQTPLLEDLILEQETSPLATPTAAPVPITAEELFGSVTEAHLSQSDGEFELRRRPNYPFLVAMAVALTMVGFIVGIIVLVADSGTEESKKDQAAKRLVSKEPSPKLPQSFSEPMPLARWSFESGTLDSIGELHGTLNGGAIITDGRLQLKTEKAYMEAGPLPHDISQRTLSVWLRLPSLTQGKRAVMVIERNGLDCWDGILFGENEPRRWYPGSSYNHRSRNVGGSFENAAPAQLVHLATTYAADNSITLYRNGDVYGGPFVPQSDISTIQTYPSNSSKISLGINEPGHPRSLICEIEEASLYDRALSRKEIADLFRRGLHKSLNHDTNRVAQLGRKRFLSDMQEFEVRVSEGRFGKKGALGYSAGNPPNSRILVNKKQSPNGISMCPSSQKYASAKYSLKGSATSFVGTVALNDSAGGAGKPPGIGNIPTPLTFQILGDGSLIWKSKPVDQARDPQDFSVNVTDVDVLELRVDCPGSYVNAQAVWVEPYVLMKPENPTSFQPAKDGAVDASMLRVLIPPFRGGDQKTGLYGVRGLAFVSTKDAANPQFFSCNRDFVTLWEINDNRTKCERINEKKFEGNLNCLTGCSKTDSIAFGCEDGTVHVCKANQTPAEATILKSVKHKYGVTCLAFSHLGKWLATAGQDGQVNLLDLKSEALTRMQNKAGSAQNLAFIESGDSRWPLLVSGHADGSLCLWRVNSPFALRVTQAHEGEINCLASSPDGKIVVSGGHDGVVQTWRLAEAVGTIVGLERVSSPISPHRLDRPVRFLAFSVDSRYLLAAFDDMALEITDLHSNKKVVENFRCQELVSNAVFSPDGKGLLIGHNNGTMVYYALPKQLYASLHQTK